MGMITVIITFIVPVLYIFGGILFIFRAPAYQCKGPAYKTKRAGLSKNTWHYANFNFGIVSIFMGIYIFIMTSLADAIFWRIGLRSFEAFAFCILAVMIQIALVLLPVYHTEQHLKDYFDEEGRPLFEEKKHRFFKRKNEEEWDDWRDPPEEGEEGWDDWQTWLRKRDIELDRQRELREAEERAEKESSLSEDRETDDQFEEELEKLFEELEKVGTVPDEPEATEITEESTPEGTEYTSSEESLAENVKTEEEDES